MSVYFVARISITDESEYNQYLERCDEVFSQYKGEYLAVDPFPETIEGEMKTGRSVIIRFPDKSAFNAWYFSEEYQEILKYRLNGADCHTIVVKGK